MKKILVVDDEESIRKLMVMFLETTFKKDTLMVIEAKDGAEAMEKFSPDIDLVITDLFMPRVGGFELANFVRKSSDSTKILMATGSMVGHEIPSNSKINDFLLKPFRLEDFTEAVSKLL